MNLKYLYNSSLLIKDFIFFSLQARSIDTADSPYLYSFISHVLRNPPLETELKAWQKIEKLRSRFKENKGVIMKTNLGAGSKVKAVSQQSVGDIARSSVSNATKCQLLYAIAKHYNAQTILELGSSLGISSGYLSLVNTVERIVSIEGDKEIYNIAQTHKISDKITFQNYQFDQALKLQCGHFDMIIIDGDHQYSSTLSYKEQCKTLLRNGGIIVFDDIYWSEGMKRAWNEIRRDESFNVCIDLFYFGIVTFDLKIKEPIDTKIMPWHRRWQIGLFR